MGRELSQDTSQNDKGSAGLSGGCLGGPRILTLLTRREVGVGGYRHWSFVGPTLGPKPSGDAACVSCSRLLTAAELKSAQPVVVISALRDVRRI